MKTFEFLISESFATTFDIEANTKEEAEEIFRRKGYDEDDIRRECIEWFIESVEEQKWKLENY